jgi:ABC-type glutathione transport system ATPase component
LSVSEVQPVSARTGAKPSAIKVQNVSLTYRTTFERVPTFKSAITRLGRGERAVREVEAVRDVSFVVPHGTTLGIIGANGAGKTTLMRMIAGISAGRVVVSFVGDTVRGRVRQLTGDELPIIEAAPGTLVEVIEKILDDRAAARDVASAGPLSVREHHDGRRSAAALAPFLTGATP